jgi:hypothetical protein
MKPGAKLDKAVEEAANPNLTGDQLADLFTRIATMGYFMSTEVGRLHRNFLQAEADRKRYAAKTVIVRTMDGTSNAKAVAALESSDEFWGYKNTEIDAEAEYQAYRLKLDGCKGVLNSIQMRLALLRDEAGRTRTS